VENEELVEVDPLDLLGDDTPAEATDEPAEPEAEPTAPSVNEAEKLAPGTPDKVLQKVQQDLGTALREIASLKAGGQSNPAKVESAERKVDSIRKKLAEEFDVFETGADLGHVIVEHEDEIAALKAKVAVFEVESSWKKTCEEFPAVPRKALEELWVKAKKYHADRMGQNANEEVFARYATETFEQYAKSAQVKSAMTTTTTKKNPVVRAAPESAQPGAAATESQEAAGYTPAELEYRKLAMQLVPTDD